MILNAEQTMLRDTVAQFFQERAPVSALRALQSHDDSHSYDAALWAEMVELGLPAITVPEAFDGLDFGWMGLGAIAQEAGRYLVASPLLSSVVMAQNVLLNCGSTAQIETYLPGLLSGEATAAFAIDEGRYFDPETIGLAEEARSTVRSKDPGSRYRFGLIGFLRCPQSVGCHGRCSDSQQCRWR